MAHQYKLIYFNLRARAEPLRLIFAYAGIKYTDQRVEFADWPGLKPKTPFGQLPVLDIDNGKVILAQTKSIARYLGKEFDLVPKDNIQAAKGDMLLDGYEDLLHHFDPFFKERDPAKQKELWSQLESKHVKPFLKMYEKFLADNGTGYFLTNKVTWADIFLFEALHKMKTRDVASPNLFDEYPKLNEFIEKIGNEPKIKEWMEKRPKTPF